MIIKKWKATTSFRKGQGKKQKLVNYKCCVSKITKGKQQTTLNYIKLKKSKQNNKKWTINSFANSSTILFS